MPMRIESSKLVNTILGEFELGAGVGSALLDELVVGGIAVPRYLRRRECSTLCPLLLTITYGLSRQHG